MNIRFGSPNIQCDEGLFAQIERIIDSGWVSMGSYVESLETHFKTMQGVKHAIACSSATTGLIIAIKAAGWKNKRVHLPAFTWPSTPYAIGCNNNTASFHDIDLDTWMMETVRENIYRADCILQVDTFGNQAPIHIDFPYENRIYDAAHGYGLPDLGLRGIAEVVSLSFTKVVTSMEGGIILTNDDRLAVTATELRRLTGRMGEINALVALRSIRDYDPLLTQKIINYYKKHITIPYAYQNVLTHTNNSVFSLVFNETSVRNAIMVALAKAGVETKVYYDPVLRGLPNTERIYNGILSLPIHSDVVHVQDDIIEIINTAGRGAKTPGKEFLSNV